MIRIPERIRHITYQAGQRAPTADTWTTWDTVIPAPAATFADLGSGYQLTDLRGNGVHWRFAEAPLFRLWLFNTTAKTTAEKPITDFDSQTKAVAGNVTTLTYTDTGTSDVVTITATLDGATGTLKFGVACTITDAGKSIYMLALPNLRLISYVENEPSRMNVATPRHGGTLYFGTPNQQIQTIRRYMYPAFQASGIITADPYVGLNRETCAFQALYHWHSTSGAGLMIRADDPDLRGKAFYFEPTADQTVTTGVHVYPADNFEVQTFTASYDVWVHPMLGNWDEAAETYRDWIFENTDRYTWANARADLLSSAVLVNDGGANGANASEHVLKKHYILWLQAAGNGNNQTNAATWTRLTAEVSRVRSYFGRDPIIYLYGYSSDNFLENVPDLTFDIAEAKTFVQAMNAASVPVVFYSIPQLAGVNSTWLASGYNGAYGDPDNVLVIDEATGNPKSSFEVDTDTPDSEHNYINLAIANGRNHAIDAWKKFVDPAVATDYLCDGFYLDAMTGAYGPFLGESRATLTSAQRGIGSGSIWQGMLTYFAALRAATRAYTGREKAMLSSEYIHEAVVSYMDLCGRHCNPIGDTELQTYVPMFERMFSGRMHANTFEPLVGYSWPVWSIIADAERWRTTWLFHAGGMPTLAWFGVYDGTIPYLIGDSGDADYSTVWVPYQSDVMAVAKACVDMRASSASVFFTGERLRAPRGSHEDLVSKFGFSLKSTGTYQVGNAQYMASFWRNRTTGGRQWILFLSNHRTAATDQIDVRIDSFQYPELGAGVKYLYDSALNNRGTFTTSLDLRTSVPALSVQKWIITDYPVVVDE